MFNCTNESALKAGEVACFYSSKERQYFFAVRGDEGLGRIDPVYVLLAYAFSKETNPGTIWTSYTRDKDWVTAANGLTQLAQLNGGASSFSYAIAPVGEKKQFEGVRTFVRVTLEGSAPKDDKIITEGTIFEPNARGFHNIPRMYLLAALAIEGKLGASVAALVVNAKGAVLATGAKAYREHGCGHAEVRALFSIRGEVPPNWAIFSTLKPCVMCAGLIQALQQTGYRQYWARQDPSIAASPASYTKAGIEMKTGQCVWRFEDNHHGIRVPVGSDIKDFTETFGSAWNQQKTRATRAAQKGNDIGQGIIEFIGGDKSAVSLRDAARQTLAAKFVKYGKSPAEAKAVAGQSPARAGRKKASDPRMQEISDHLYTVVSAAKR